MRLESPPRVMWPICADVTVESARGLLLLAIAMAWQHVDSPDKVTSWFLRDSPGFQIVADLAPREDEAVFDKIGEQQESDEPFTFEEDIF